MANGKAIKNLKKIVEGEHLAANALAVAANKAKELDIQQFLAELGNRHETNAVSAGSKLKELGGKYPVPGLRDSLKKGWESVATTKTTTDAMKLLHKKEREAIQGYKGMLKQAKDENSLRFLAKNLANSTDNLADLSDKIKHLQEKAKKNKKKSGKILGLPKLIWLLALGIGAAVFVRKVQSDNASNASKNGSAS